MFLWNKTSTEWGRICWSWKNCRKYQTKKRTDWKRPEFWKKISRCQSPGRCLSENLRNPNWEVQLWLCHPHNRIPSSPWHQLVNTHQYLAIWDFLNHNLVITAVSHQFPILRPSDTSNNLLRWRPVLVVTSRFIEMLPFVHFVKLNPDHETQRSQKRKSKSIFLFMSC